ncbi:MAG: ribonuclease HII [Patescibacteria group bacterium]|nr:ribonuclease HII [Patescibacteria group bacterium]
MIGIDEAGRGALAGPLVVASVRLDHSYDFGSLPIRDSKTLSPRQRTRIFDAIQSFHIPFQTIIIDVSDINTYGIGWANITGIRQLLERPGLSMRLTEDVRVVVDGRFPMEKIAVDGVDVSCQVDADATVLPVILAGIVAKVTRDRIMQCLHTEYGMYGWERNNGYGTQEHIASIQRFGMCPYHRRQFVKTALRKKSINLLGLSN